MISSPDAIRKGLIESLPAIDHAGVRVSQAVEYTFVPPSHAKALDPDSSLIEGIRGAGKSFWWAALLSPDHRSFVSKAFADAHLPVGLQVEHGFGDSSGSAGTPTKDVIEALVQKYTSRAVWRAVLAEKAGFGGEFEQLSRQPSTTWDDRVRWVSSNAEKFEHALADADARLARRDSFLVIVFDALDRLANTWEEIRPLARSLLQVGLDVRATQRIRFKMFVRPDMLEDQQIVGFPDASKLLARRTALTWRRVDLYALLFQCLGNSPSGGRDFRQYVRVRFGLSYRKTGDHWLVPDGLRGDEGLQEQVFIGIAGKAMSASPTGQKRGKPYSWLVNHLLDGRDQVSPRSFAAAVRHAAERTQEEYFNHRFALHFGGIQAGVQAASQVRVDELVKEDYPWVSVLMRPLKGNLTVPCFARDIGTLWKKNRVLDELFTLLRDERPTVKLPPQRLDEGYLGVLQDLEDLGVIQWLRDGRVQMPDVYRIAFGLGRKGGVKPLR